MVCTFAPIVAWVSFWQPFSAFFSILATPKSQTAASVNAARSQLEQAGIKISGLHGSSNRIARCAFIVCYNMRRCSNQVFSFICNFGDRFIRIGIWGSGNNADLTEHLWTFLEETDGYTVQNKFCLLTKLLF